MSDRPPFTTEPSVVQRILAWIVALSVATALTYVILLLLSLFWVKVLIAGAAFMMFTILGYMLMDEMFTERNIDRIVQKMQDNTKEQREN